MENPMIFEKLNAIIIGATGATGREIVSSCLKSNIWGKIFVPVRRKISRFENLSEEINKLRIIEVEDLEILNKDKAEIIQKFGEEFSKVSLIFKLD